MREKKEGFVRQLCIMAMLALLISAALCPAPSFAAGKMDASAASVGDEAGLLTDEERASLVAKIQQVEQKHGVRIGIQTRQSVKGSAGNAANALLDANYSGGANGGIVLLVVMGSRDWYISTDNAMRKRITDDAGINHLSGRFLSDLGDGRYAAAFSAYVDTVDSMLSYYEREGEPYDPAGEFNPLALLIALAFAILAGISLRSMLIASMSNVRNAAEAGAYLVNDSVSITESSDRFLFMNVTRVRKQKRSSSTGSRDSSHGGGGGKF